jgi:thiaminase/transcriptional activator TenA
VNFSQHAWQQIEDLYAAILEMPFNQELAAGTLSRDRFTFYLLQDSHYLSYFARALAATAARAPDNEALIELAGSARETMVEERALHDGFYAEYGITQAEAEAAEPSPTCSHYTHYLLGVACNAPYEVAVAALLPCFWIYWEVGKQLLQTARPGNPYQAWIDNYADPAFGEGVEKMIAISDQVAASSTPAVRADMTRAFRRATQLEWMFWDSAYRLEEWPVA